MTTIMAIQTTLMGGGVLLVIKGELYGMGKFEEVRLVRDFRALFKDKTESQSKFRTYQLIKNMKEL
jgi:hypothetical protein